MSVPCLELDEFAVFLCYEFLGGTETKRREIEAMANDDDILWFFEAFIDRQAAAIEKGSDTEALLLGFTAVAIIGPNSDPRDVTLWLGDLYLTAVIASIPERAQLCERVGSLAAEKWGVAEQIRMFPSRNEKTTQRHTELKRKWELSELFETENEPDASGLTPLMHAALKGKIPKLTDLIRSGVDVNAMRNGASALAFAAFAGHDQAVELLLDAGARVDIKPHGMSLLKFADLGEAKPAISELLRRAGAT
ncbi:MAG TPA: ankyrin repeat domain-containing protein [Dongiaceae bacterium]|nr:ankyrin repeat domain-containing protein [Dongiaceae bacterium]